MRFVKHVVKKTFVILRVKCKNVQVFKMFCAKITHLIPILTFKYIQKKKKKVRNMIS